MVLMVVGASVIGSSSNISGRLQVSTPEIACRKDLLVLVTVNLKST
jgi:hypothetical protein